MKIQNTTPYRTEDLRKWVSAALKSQGAHGKSLLVQITNGTWMRGRAYLGSQIRVKDADGITHHGALRQGKWMLIRIPKPPTEINLATLAWLLMHEIQHLRGIRHKEMTDAMRRVGDNPLPAWAEGLVLRPRVKAKVPRQARLADVVARRRAHAEAMLARWQRRERAAKTMRQKWEAKVRYYERKDERAAKSAELDQIELTP